MRTSVPGVTIRPFRSDDAGFVRVLAGRAFAGYSREPQHTIGPMLRERGAHTLVAERDAVAVGFVVVQVDRLAVDFGPWQRPAVARINAIAVRADAQGRGIGRMLVEHAETIARSESARSISLATGENNVRARRLFASAGFVPLATVAGYYAGGHAGILMHRALIG